MAYLRSGSAQVIPAATGTVLQITYASIYYTDTSNNNADVTTSTSLARAVQSGNYYWKGSISNVLASSHVHVTMFCYIECGASDYEVGARMGIFADTDGAGTNLRTIYDSGPNSKWAFRAVGATATVFRSLPEIHAIDTAPATGTNYYILGYGASTSGDSVHCKSAQDYSPYICTLMEIAQ